MFLLDKPQGWTSFDVVAVVRRATGVRRTGHAGTLDPLATGLLIVCTGPATKQISRYTGLDKVYTVAMELGARTASYDTETPVLERRTLEGVTGERVRAILDGFTGPQRQIPPMHSAVKIGGRRLYTLARRGKEIERPARDVVIYAVEDVCVALPEVRFTVRCSKGTYVRSIVNDAGTALGCGAVMTALRRTAIGPYRVEDALTPEAFEERVGTLRPVHA
jgi:tRNA pseudouridine55 synthase